MNWDDAEEIGVMLYEEYPELDPLSVRFTDMHRLVMELPGFEGEADDSSEGQLEAIQMAWLDEYRDQQ